jgi:DNA-3-methyladenine glycosylase I
MVYFDSSDIEGGSVLEPNALPMTKLLQPTSGGKIRCGWVGGKPHFIVYHDQEWGVPIHDDRKHFEMLLLEGAQAGLTWETILLRRDGYRRAFAEFDPKKVARFTAKKKALLLKNPGIRRNLVTSIIMSGNLSVENRK